MRILKGAQIETIDENGFRSLTQDYKNIVIDIGTGDGSFLYRRAKKEKDNFFIGIDAAMDNMVENAVKSCKNPSKGGVDNLLFVVSNALSLSEILTRQADRVSINLPWGSLMEGVVKGEEVLLQEVRKICKPKAVIDIYVTYSSAYEEAEINARELPKLTKSFIETDLKQKYQAAGIELKKVQMCTNEDLKALDTSWAKKLAYGKPREIFYIQCRAK